MESEFLPHDAVRDILLRLPVKSLKRFKCVCRSWCSYFDEPDFGREHYLTNAARGTNLRTIVRSIPLCDPLFYDPLHFKSRIVVNFSLLCNETMRARETVDIPSLAFPVTVKDANMVSECEGLIILRNSNKSDTLFLLNPATQELKTLPEPAYRRPPYAGSARRSKFCLGYDCCTSDYKVVGIFTKFDESFEFETIDQVELYTLRSNSWRTIAYPLEPLLLCDSRYNTYLNGHCHWWFFDVATDVLYEGQRILAFDMTQETFQTMEVPSCSGFLHCFIDLELSKEIELTVFRNYLALFGHSKENMDCFEIWVMKEYGVMESWTKQLVIGPISRVRELPGDLPGELLGMWKTGEWFFETNDHRLALFNPQTKAIKDLEIQQYRKAGPVSIILFIFTESLFSLNGR